MKTSAHLQLAVILFFIICCPEVVIGRWCPGYPLQYSCNTASNLLWSGTVFTGQCSAERITVNNDASVSCGLLNTTNIYIPDPNFPQVTLIQSNLRFIPGVESMGATIRCTIPTRILLDTTLNLIVNVFDSYQIIVQALSGGDIATDNNITPRNLSSTQVNSSYQQLFWNVNSEMMSCNLTYSLIITRVSQPEASFTIPKVNSGHILSLSPGVYNYVVVSMSGVEQASSNPEQFFIMNKPSAPYVRTTTDGCCFMYTTTIYWQLYTNDTTPPILHYVFALEDQQAIIVDDEQIEINTSMTTVELQLKLGISRLICFTVNAVNILGIGEGIRLCIEVPSAILSIGLETTNDSAIFSYTLDASCVNNELYSIATEVQETNSVKFTNQSMINGTFLQHLISNLRPGTGYEYCVVFSSVDGVSKRIICGVDLPHGGVLTTDKPKPPADINGAMLVTGTFNEAMYKCVNDLEIFNDGSVITVAEFDVSTQTYVINGTCTIISQFITVTTTSVIVTSVGTLALGVFVGSLITYYVMKKKGLKQQLQQQLDSNYDVVANLGAINRSFEMEGNIAYGPIRKYSMEENAAYVSNRGRST